MSDSSSKTLECDKLIVSIGRVPNTEGLNAALVQLKLDERGALAVDEDCCTNLPNVWAIGDAVRGLMLAHKADEEGVAVAECIADQKPRVAVLYATREAAWTRAGRRKSALRANAPARVPSSDRTRCCAPRSGGARGKPGSLL